MHNLFLSEKTVKKVSYKVYWKVFIKKFKLKFGLPRSDAFGLCDHLTHEIVTAGNTEEETALRKQYRNKARNNPDHYTCISFDYMQALLFPHIRTIEVFYSFQMWYFVFDIRDEGNNSASMYCCNESFDETREVRPGIYNFRSAESWFS